MPPVTLPPRLEDLPNIGQSIAADLRAIGIATPKQLAGRDPLSTYLQLGGPMGRRHDPCPRRMSAAPAGAERGLLGRPTRPDRSRVAWGGPGRRPASRARHRVGR